MSTSELEWLRKCWKSANVKAVEDRYAITFLKPPLPDDISSVDEARAWYKKVAREWISEVKREKIDARR